VIFEPRDLTALRDRVANADRVLISTHVHPDADAIGSALAIQEMVRSLGGRPHVVLEEGCPPRYRFLDRSETIIDYRTLTDPAKYEACIIVDSGGKDRIGPVVELLNEATWIANIDHHVSNTRYGNINWIAVECAATSELLFELNSALGLTLSKEMANQLYAGVLTDTGRFRYSNTTARTMQIVSELIAHGADVFHLTDQLFYSISSKDVYSIGAILSSLELFNGGLISTLFVKHENLLEDPDTIVDLALSVRGVEVAAMFSETHDGKIRISLRAKHFVNVSAIAAQFGGGGHVSAAGCRMRGTLESARAIVLPAIQAAVDAVQSQHGEKPL
jgi:bifunctional oligoribonuclease and PAP phosphatase NrnA